MDRKETERNLYRTQPQLAVERPHEDENREKDVGQKVCDEIVGGGELHGLHAEKQENARQRYVDEHGDATQIVGSGPCVLNPECWSHPVEGLQTANQHLEVSLGPATLLL